MSKSCRYEWTLNYCRFGIWDFGNKVKYLYFSQNIEVYTSEIQYPISEINGFYYASYSTSYEFEYQDINKHTQNSSLKTQNSTLT